jgi:alpha-ketoglutarate-dependent taurine dioxygenase
LDRHRARSETMQDFPWHTDCSYASSPPRFFGLHVLQADKCGGGTLSILQLSKIMGSVKDQSLEALRAPEFRIEVPPEFAIGTDAIISPILTPIRADSSGQADVRCRFRADIVQLLTERASTALAELNQVLALARDTHSDVCLNLIPELLPNGSIVLLDNGRWLHARNEAKDAERHLRRIRWDARDFQA